MCKKIVVYTVVCGNYDSIYSVSDSDNIDFVLVTDYFFNGKIPNGWKHLRLEKSKLSNKDLNRYYKMKPHELFADYDVSVYIDGNISIVSPLYAYIKKAVFDYDIALYSHFERNNIVDEAKKIALSGLDYAWILKNQINNYFINGYIDNNLYEANVIFRNHNKDIVKVAMNQWWDEYIKFSKRDQISLPYILINSNIKCNNLGLSDARFDNDYFCYNLHNKNKSKDFSDLIKKIINRMYFLIYEIK